MAAYASLDFQQSPPGGNGTLAMLFSGLDGVRRDFLEGREEAAADFLVALLAYARQTRTDWQALRVMLATHPLHTALQRDPLTLQSCSQPAVSGGSLELVDAVSGYDRHVRRGKGRSDLISRALASGIGETLRRRQAQGSILLADALAAGRRICVLSSGYLRELDDLAGKDLRGLIAVEAEPAAIQRIRNLHGQNVEIIAERPLDWLARASSEVEEFDLIYAGRLSDTLDDTGLIHALTSAARLLAPGGRLVVQSIGNHCLAGYMEAAMNWIMTYRDHDDMAALAEQAGLTYRLSVTGKPPLITCEAWRPG